MRALRRRLVRTLTLVAGPTVLLGNRSDAIAQTLTQAPFSAVLPDTRLSFPRDHGSHPSFRIEWWYLTGWLETLPAAGAGLSIGVQITFFRVATGYQHTHTSRFAARQLLFAHAALAIPGQPRLIAAERAARTGLGLVEASERDTHLSIGNWTLRRDANDRYQATIVDPALAIELTLSANGPPVLQGDDGFSRKGPQSAQASHYYSRPWLDAEGRFSARAGSAESSAKVRGKVWFDHEWSSELLDVDAQGWDWVGLHLDDGSALMAFRIRARSGADVWRHANWVDEGRRQLLSSAERNSPRFETLRSWRSPRSGARWPVAQRLWIGGRTFELQPLMDDQELETRGSTGVTYWEGAVIVTESGRAVGRGYLELTGYAQPMRL